jgi:NitT/TauT family transport system substrate-binding protein
MDPRVFKRAAELALSALIWVAACAHAQAQELIRIGTNLWPGYAPLHLAADRHEWDKRSRIRLVDYPSTSEVMRAFRNGLIEGAAVTLDELLVLADGGVPATAVLVFDISMGGDAIIARPELTDVTDLRGKRIGVESGALGAYVLTRALELHELSLQDVEIVSVDLGSHEDTFTEGAVDAVVTFEPVRSRLLKAGGREIFSSREIPGEIVDVLAVRNDILSSDARVVREIIDGWFEALNYLSTNPEEACAAISRRLRIPPESVRESYARLELPDRDRNRALLGGSLTPVLTRLHETSVKHRLLDPGPAPSGLLTDSFLQGCSRCAD